MCIHNIYIYVCIYICIYMMCAHTKCHTRIYIYIYIYMMKISGKVEKPNTFNGFSSNISLFIQRRTSSERIKNEILLLNPL